MKPNFARIFIAFSLSILVSTCKVSPVSPSSNRTSTDIFDPASTLSPTPTSIPSTAPTYTVTPIPTVGDIDSMVSEKDGMTLVYIPEGKFIMGADRSVGYQACQELGEPFIDYYECNKDVYDDEDPIHEIWLDAFWIDQTEVTNTMYAALLNAVGNTIDWGEPWYDASDPEARIHKINGVWKADEDYEDHPVTLVTWYGARSYCERVGRRLPTEAEWEKAARGTDQRIYPWGDEFDGTKLNFCDQTCQRLSSNPYFIDGYGITSPVGSFPQGASPYGVLDMAGNVLEWVFDRYSDEYYEISPNMNPEGPAESFGDIRVERGGSWLNTGNVTSVINRTHDVPVFQGIHLGFRCVLSE